MYRKDGTKCTTRIRKVEGNCDAFIKEIRRVLKIPLPTTNEGDCIRVRTGGTVEIKGNRVREVKEWLAGLGF